MNCQVHPDVPATAYCRNCGKPVCNECRRDAYGTVFCPDHAPTPAAPPPYAEPAAPGMPPPPPPYTYPIPAAAPDVSPALAFFLGMIPGVGAIYNGQYAKGLVHALIWGILMSIANSRAVQGMEPVFGIMVAAWWFYMAFEAYHTARKRRMGEPVDEYSSLIDFRGNKSQVPVAGVALIVLGILLLLHTLDLLDFERIARYWPVVLIAGGAYLLWGRLAGDDAAPKEARHERH
jgi:LiaI-LiaF-like transmembrane region/B-box zinc finger